MTGADVGGTNVNVTGRVFVVAPLAATVTRALYVPAPRPEVLTVATTVPEFVPVVGLSVSHAALSVAVQDSVPLPVVVTLMLCAAGLVPPAAPLKLSADGPRVITGVEAAEITRDTGTLVYRLLPSTPFSVMVTVAE